MDDRGTWRGWLKAICLAAFLAWFLWFTFYGFREWACGDK